MTIEEQNFIFEYIYIYNIFWFKWTAMKYFICSVNKNYIQMEIPPTKKFCTNVNVEYLSEFTITDGHNHFFVPYRCLHILQRNSMKINTALLFWKDKIILWWLDQHRLTFKCKNIFRDFWMTLTADFEFPRIYVRKLYGVQSAMFSPRLCEITHKSID